MVTSLLSRLDDLHLPKNEAAVYVAVAQLGTTSTGDIIRKTRLHRVLVYEALDRLVSKRLVWKFSKHKIAHFQLTDPERLLQNAQEQVDVAHSAIRDIKKLLTTKGPEINVYEGIEDYRRFWIESAKRFPVGSTDYVAGSIGNLWHEYMGKTADTLFKIRIERKIKWKMLIFYRDQADLQLLHKYPKLHEYRFIDKHASRFGNFNVFEKTSVILHSATEPMIIEVKNDTLVKVFQNLFDILWESGKPIR